MRISRLALAAVLAAGTLPVAACAEDAPAADADDVAAAAASSGGAPADSVSGPSPAVPPDAAARPDRIYYDLTRFDWYAHGEPLVFDSMPYEPDGRPVALDARTLERVGAYDGVDVYRRGSDTHLYVPVYDGYWLAFEPAGG